MSKFQCRNCGDELEAKTPPFGCKACGAKGQGFDNLSAKSPAPAAQAPAQQASSTSTQSAGSQSQFVNDPRWDNTPWPAGQLSDAPNPNPNRVKPPRFVPKPLVKKADEKPAENPVPVLTPIPQPEVIPTVIKAEPLPQAPRTPETPPPPAAREPEPAAPPKPEPSIAPAPAVEVPVQQQSTSSAQQVTAAETVTTERPQPAPEPVVASKPVELPPAPPAPTPPEPAPDTRRIAWRFALPQLAKQSVWPMRSGPVIDAQQRAFYCLQNRLIMMEPGESKPAWEYTTGGPIPRAPALGSDGILRLHSSDGFLHAVDSTGKPGFAAVSVGDPLDWSTPLVDDANNTWVCRSEGGIVKIDAQGKTAGRDFLRTRRRFDCTGLIRNDYLYVGCEDHYVYAVCLANARGSNSWADSPSLGRTGCPIHAPIVLSGGNELLVVSLDDTLRAFSLDGTSAWSVELPGHVLGSPVITADGTILLGVGQNLWNQQSRGILMGLDSTTHREKFRVEFDYPIESTPVIAAGGSIYFGDNNGDVHAIDKSGQTLWKVNVGSPVRSQGAMIGPQLVVFGLDDGSLVALHCDS